MSKFAAMALAVDTPARMTILHPTKGTPLGEAFIDLLSTDSEAAQKFDREVNNRRLSQRVRRTLTSDELEAEQAERLSRLTVAWSLADLEGKPLDIPFSQKDALEMYGAREMRWLRDQVEQFLGNRANFTQDSSKTS